MDQGLIPTAGAVARLIQELNKLPGIGLKSAQRLAYHLLRAPEEQSKLLADAILSVKQKTRLCSVCFNITDTDPCPICRNDQRDQTKICIVEQPQDILAKGWHSNRGYFSDQPHIRGRADRHVFKQADFSPGHQSYPPCPGTPLRHRAGIRRRRYPHPSHRGQAGVLELGRNLSP
jgi:hypothetical protein